MEKILNLAMKVTLSSLHNTGEKEIRISIREPIAETPLKSILTCLPP